MFLTVITSVEFESFGDFEITYSYIYRDPVLVVSEMKAEYLIDIVKEQYTCKIFTSFYSLKK